MPPVALAVLAFCHWAPQSFIRARAASCASVGGFFAAGAAVVGFAAAVEAEGAAGLGFAGAVLWAAAGGFCGCDVWALAGRVMAAIAATAAMELTIGLNIVISSQ
ncbi:conserved membrane hypothetical protein [Hyphomicrobiales bacterium]|nr:conserved membrane hypothetical protein [Hyphomicrobiales bacterium]CAH1677987.1 conserved membrane hypothetical protein [Hyphomicrobiales bacterium]